MYLHAAQPPPSPPNYLTDNKKKLARNYLKAAGYYSYDAAADDENPVMRWIGREVKPFISEAHIHIPFLLRLANAPPEVSGVYQEVELDGALLPLPLPSPLSPPPSLYLCVPAEDGAYQAHEDDELFLTPEELEAEAQEEPQMMAHAAMWDRYLAYVAKTQEEWAAAPADTDEYRKGRAVEYFNLGTRSYLCTLLLLYSLHPLYLLLILYPLTPTQVLPRCEISTR